MALTESQEKQAEKNLRYWKDREKEAQRRYITDEKELEKQVKKIYDNMLDGIQGEINAFYGRYADKEGISINEAKKRVKQADIKAYERKAEKYVKERDFSKKANEEMRLYNATMRINRLEMLKANIGLELVSGFDELDKQAQEAMLERALKEYERMAAILGDSAWKPEQVKDVAKGIVNASFHNATFSDRIWMYQDMMRSDLSKLLQSGMIQGKNARVLARELQKAFQTSTYNAERLMRTELTRINTEVQKSSFERNGFGQYMFIVNGTCCDICRELDGKVFDVKDMTPGKNAPPMHPHCRCSTAAYSDRAEYEEWLDHLSKGGTTEEWNKAKTGAKSTRNQKKPNKTLEISEKHGKMETKGSAFSPSISKDTFQKAKDGERHAGVYKDATKKTEAELVKSIASHNNQVNIHIDKIEHPEKYVDDWQSKPQQQKDGLMRKWKKDAQRNAEQAAVEAEVFKERFGKEP